jgi:integrase
MELMAITVSYEHIKHLLHAVKFLHEARGLVFPEHDFDIVTTLHGLKRKLARVPHQALPITPEILRALFQKLDKNSLKDKALWCSYLITFYCLFRKSNSVPKSLSKLNLKRTLLRKHILIDVASNIVYVNVTFSKTNQFGNKNIVIPIPGNSDPALDPVRHLSELFSLVKCSEDAPAFSYGVNKFISYSLFTNMLKKLLSSSGYNPALFSGHSFRRGGATFLYRLGASILQIQVSGDWVSQCFARYLHVSEEERFHVQNLISAAISSGAA